MPVAEIGKTYTYNGKKYVAREAKGEVPCVECDLYTTVGCVEMMRDGIVYTCIDGTEMDTVIFKELENGND